eukprot:4370058-Prymnesium_polylepis.1
MNYAYAGNPAPQDFRSNPVFPFIPVPYSPRPIPLAARGVPEGLSPPKGEGDHPVALIATDRSSR